MRILFKCTSADEMPVYITGNHPSLGEWDVSRAMPMQVQTEEGNGARDWSAVVELEPGRTIEYKFIKKSGDHTIWEGGWNRFYTAVPGTSSISDGFRT
jgi:hypothetical protein